MAEQPSICSAIGTNLRRVPPYSHGVGIWIMLPECQRPLILSHAHMVNGNLQCIVLRNGKEVMHRSHCIHAQVVKPFTFVVQCTVSGYFPSN